jgi:Divergent InlB B-repeat domain
MSVVSRSAAVAALLAVAGCSSRHNAQPEHGARTDASIGLAVGDVAALVTAPDVALDSAVPVSSQHGCTPVSAFDGSVYLVVWCDDRAGDDDVFAARISAEGILLDLAGIPVAVAEGPQVQPDVVFDGQNFVVVWMDGRYGEGWELYGARVDGAGRILDPAGIPIAAGPGDRSWPRIESDGSSSLVVWSELRSNYGVYAARLGPDGTVKNPGSFIISDNAAHELAPDLAYNGSVYLVTYLGTVGLGTAQQRTGILASRVGTSGTVVTAPVLVGDGGTGYVHYPARVAALGSEFLVTYMVQPQGTLTFVAFWQRVDSTGQPVGMSTAYQGGSAPISVASNGTSYLLTWGTSPTQNSFGTVYQLRLDAAGGIVDGTEANSVDGVHFMPTVEVAGAGFLNTWLLRADSTHWNVWANRLGPTRQVLDAKPIQLTSTPAWSSERLGSMACDGQHMLLVWSDTRGGTRDIYGIRLDQAGTPVEQQAFVVATSAGEQGRPVAVFDGEKFIVAWLERANSGAAWNIRARAVTTSGVPDGLDVLVANTSSVALVDLAAATDGTRTLVVWGDRRNGNWDVYGARIARDLTVLDPSGLPVAVLLRDQRQPRVAFDGTAFLVTWTDERSGNRDVYAGRVTAAGALLDPAGIAVSTGAGAQDEPDIAALSQGWVIAWRDARAGTAVVRAARLGAAGSLLDPSGLDLSAGNAGLGPRVAFDGRKAFVLWTSTEDAALQAVQVDGAGTISGATTIASGTQPGRTPVVFNHAGRGVVALSRFDDFLGAVRARAALVTTWSRMSVTRSGTGAGTVTSAPAGIDCGAYCSAELDADFQVALTATPALGSRFVGWSGDCSGTGGCSLAMSSHHAVNAEFERVLYALTVSRAGAGGGTVTSEPSGIDCGAACTASYPAGTSITLTAHPAAGSVFAGWMGACAGSSTCTISLDAPASAAARFEPTFRLTLNRTGTGTGTVTSDVGGLSCGSTCAADYSAGTVVTLTATPGANSTFAGWTGPCTGSGTCTVTMVQARSVGVSFTAVAFTLTVTKQGAGSGTVVGSPGSIACGATCTDSFPAGTSVTLVAAPDEGSRFAGWSGACSGTGSCAVTVNASAAITATFENVTYPVTVVKIGSGSGRVSGDVGGVDCGATCSASYEQDASLTFTAVAEAGSEFKGWTGPCSGAGTCTLHVAQATVVQARFDAVVPQKSGGGGCSAGGGLGGAWAILAALAALARMRSRRPVGDDLAAPADPVASGPNASRSGG